MASNKNWLKLDTAAKLYPSISDTHNNTTFRLDMELDAPVNPELLQQALVKIIKRFPSFAVTLKRGLFWYYLDKNNAIPAVREDSGYPCRRLKDFVNNGFLFNVLYYKNNVVLECFHALTDGAGAIEFLKTLLYEYFVLCGYDMDDEGMIKDTSQPPPLSEVENSFLKYYDSRGEYTKLKQPTAYHILGTPLDDNEIYITHGVMNLKDFLKAVKSKGVTVSAYVAGLLIYSIYKEQGLSYRKEKHPIIISVPVDLRGMFKSDTLRNFVSFANVGVVPKSRMTLEEITAEVSKQLKEGLTEDRIRANINKNVKFEKNPFIRITPLFFKNIAVSTAYKTYGEGAYTMLLSNLKTTQFPESMKRHIKNVYYALGVSDQNPLNCVVVSYKENMIITFARGIAQTGIVRSFFEHFSKELGLEVEMRGNELTGSALRQ